MSRPRGPHLTPDLLAELRRRVGDEALLAAEDDLERYDHDYTEAFRFTPEAVLLPSSPDQVAEILRFATEHRLPVTPRGAGTGLSGGALAVHGGLCLSLERLDRIRGIDERNLSVEAETGVVTGELQRRVEEVGLFYPPDPASRDTCFLGGNLAENSAGPRSCKYGTTRRWVLGLEAVLADGSIVRTGGANRKDVAGYDLTQLLVGSEGTLAVITAATLRLIAKPAATLTLAIPFPELEQAAEMVETLFHQGFSPAACELIEERALLVADRLEPLPAALRQQGAVLMLELDGDSDDDLLEEAAGLGALAETLGAGTVLAAQDAAEQRRLWMVRESLGEATRAASIFKSADTVAPRSRLVDLVRAARKAAADHGLEALCFGHAGDGNLHVNLLRGDLDEETWRLRLEQAEAQLFAAVADVGGSVTGEHGIGWTQRRYLPLVRNDAAIAVMRRIKDAFDPLGILNPGKVFPI
ncbi:MAG: FAD-binding oxidoreductase [Acidobacteria bacterium]|nr:FAD-binding oxidoreductase [Acidobacteriota bacterium]